MARLIIGIVIFVGAPTACAVLTSRASPGVGGLGGFASLCTDLHLATTVSLIGLVIALWALCEEELIARLSSSQRASAAISVAMLIWLPVSLAAFRSAGACTQSGLAHAVWSVTPGFVTSGFALGLAIRAGRKAQHINRPTIILGAAALIAWIAGAAYVMLTQPGP